MENLPVSLVQPDTLTENILSINSFIKQSYSQAKKQVQGGVDFIKEEFSGLYDKTTTCLTWMALPVNNFLKDIAEIEAEFSKELNMEPDKKSSSGFVPIHLAAASGSMEENY
jgi:hypothetical protein